MSYYILPKNNNIIIVDPSNGHNSIEPIISLSIQNYYHQMIEQIKLMCNNDYDLSYNDLNNLMKIVHSYEFIFSKVPGTKFSVSKLKQKSNTFYDFLEIINTLNIFEYVKTQPINTLHICNNYEDSIECLEMLRENVCDNNIFNKKFNDDLFKSINERNIDFIYMETIGNNLNDYLLNLLQCVMVILKCSNKNSSTVIKIDDTLHKPVIDIIYLLCSLFEKVYIMKPNSNNITIFEKYIICKGFLYDETKIESYKINYYKLFVFLKKLDNNNIISIINKDLPYYFLNKIDDINIILGQQQLESLDQIVNILKNKNKDDKIDSIKKNNIQKSVSWCEKYKIPCNKFIDRTNIFLPINKEY
jgi:hypothetical protein